MSNYTLQVDWAGKDSLSDSDPAKIISGNDFNTEFAAVRTAVNSKAELAGSSGQNFTADTLTADEIVVNGNITINKGGDSSGTSMGYQTGGSYGGGTAYGYQALNTAYTYIAAGNTTGTLPAEASAFGRGALSNAAYGADQCTGIGHYAGSNVTTGESNTCLGYKAYGLSAAGTYDYVTALGRNASPTGSHQVRLGTSSESVYGGSYNTISDLRDKKEVKDTTLGLDFINKIEAVEFKLDPRDSYIDDDGNPIPNDGSKVRNRFHQGVIAQQVKAVMDELGVDFGGYQDHSHNGGEDVLTMNYLEFIGPLIKAVQELSTKVAALEGA